MNTLWKNFLLKQSTSTATHVANLSTKRDGFICDLSQFSTIVIAGNDAAAFMQGQFTNDVNQVNQQHSQISGFCNNKGRLNVNFRLFQYQQNYFFSLKKSLIDTTINDLQKYVLGAHVAIQDVSEQLIQIGVGGENATALLSEFIHQIKTEVNQVSFNENFIAIRVEGETLQYQVFCDLENAKKLWLKISAQCKVSDSSYWDYLNIQAGIAFIDKNSYQKYVPQMLNMDLINAISFEKGCYTGQEIVARLHYLGKLKKRCFKVYINTNIPPKMGDAVFAKNSHLANNTGAIISVAKNPDCGYDALAVLQVTESEAELFLNDESGAGIALKSLPYDLKIATHDSGTTAS